MYIPDIRGGGSAAPGTRIEVAGAEQQQQQQQQVFSISHVTAYDPNDPIPNAQYHPFLAWIINAISIALFTGPAPSSAAISPSATSSGPPAKRSVADSPNTLTSVVAGVLVTVFILLAGSFLYVYRRSIRFRKQGRKRRRHHRHQRRASGNSKISQGSDVGGAGGEGAGDGGAPPADAGAQA